MDPRGHCLKRTQRLRPSTRRLSQGRKLIGLDSQNNAIQKILNALKKSVDKYFFFNFHQTAFFERE